MGSGGDAVVYIKTNWVDGVTPLSATNMNKMEEGIADDGTWIKIAEQTLVSAVAQVDFASIPSGYKNFKITFDAIKNSVNSTNLKLTFNSDSTANYRYQLTRGYGSSTTSQAAVGDNFIAIQSGLASSTQTPAYGQLEISNYNSLKAKRVTGRWYSESGVTAADLNNYSLGGVWANVSAEINKISLAAYDNLIGIGSKFTLWGCK